MRFSRILVSIVSMVVLIATMLAPSTALAVPNPIDFAINFDGSVWPCNSRPCPIISGASPDGSPINWDPVLRDHGGWNLVVPSGDNLTQGIIPDVFEDNPWATFEVTAPYYFLSFDAYNPWASQSNYYMVRCNDPGTANADKAGSVPHIGVTHVVTGWTHTCASVSIGWQFLSAIDLDNFQFTNVIVGRSDYRVSTAVWTGNGGADATFLGSAFVAPNTAVAKSMNAHIDTRSCATLCAEFVSTVSLAIYDASSHLIDYCVVSGIPTPTNQNYSCALTGNKTLTAGTTYYLMDWLSGTNGGWHRTAISTAPGAGWYEYNDDLGADDGGGITNAPTTPLIRPDTEDGDILTDTTIGPLAISVSA